MKKSTRMSVDKLLLEQGKYLPLEFLFLEGRLLVEDYEAWCGSDIQCLDEMLFGDPRQILEQLIEAETYAQALGLQPSLRVYKHWKKEGNPQLMFSSIKALDRCFHTEYIKSIDQPQLDLFMDNPTGNLIHEMTSALKKNNPTEARKRLECLYNMAPDHARLGDLECLVSALEQVKTPIDDIKTTLEYLQRHIAPAAESVMGNEARTFLIPYWRRLSESLFHTPYDEDQPELHASYTAGQAFDWEMVRDEIEKEKHWERRAVLVVRHATACSRLDLRGLAIQSWFYLCWFHSSVDNALSSVVDLEIRNKWKDFLSAEPELPTEAFPAWLLLFIPGIARVLPELKTAELLKAPESYRVIYNRQKNIGNLSEGPSENEINWRSELKALDENLFQHYLYAASNAGA